MTTYLTPYTPDTRQPGGLSQPLPCATMDEAVQLMGEPDHRYPAMLLYVGPPAYCVTRFPLCIDVPSNSGHDKPDNNDSRLYP